MARTPKNIEVQDVNDESINKEAVADAMVTMREQAQEEAANVFEIGQRVGAIQATRMWRTAFRAAELKLFSELRALPVETVRNIPVKVDGIFRRAERVPEFCTLVFGASYSKLAEEQQNLEALGDEAYELAASLGLNRSALRAARALPPEKLEAVRLAIGNGGTKAEVLSVIEDLAEKVQQAEAAATEAKAELKASEEVLATKNKTIDRLQRDLKRIEKLPPDEQLAGIKKEAIDLQSETIGLVRGGLRQALIKLNDAPDDASKVAFMAGLVGAVYVELDALREEFGLSLATVDTTPEWERWANAQGANAGAGAGTAAN